MTTFFAGVTSGQQISSAIRFSNSPVASVQMTGTATWTYGSDQQSGAVSLEAYATGQSRLELQLNKGTWVETQSAFADAQRQCAWKDFDGNNHTGAAHNCWLSTTWFLPAVTLQAGAGAPDAVTATTVLADGLTARIHSERHPARTRSTRAGQLVAQLSAVDLDVDIATGNPRKLQFNSHPDSDAGTNIPTEVDYSDYHNVNGVPVPFHIQKFVNYSCVLDIHISAAQIQLATPTTASLQRFSIR